MKRILVLGEIRGDLFHLVYEAPKFFIVDIKKNKGIYEFFENGEKIYEAKSLRGISIDTIFDKVIGEYWDVLKLDSLNENVICFEKEIEKKYACYVSNLI